jgi:hypothetical protein
MSLFEAFRGPFDKAAAAFVKGDEKAVTALTTPAQARDILANVHKATTRTDNLEKMTRVLDVVSARHALYLVGNATRGLDRYGSDWFKAVRRIDGVTIKWMTHADQVAMDARIPQEMRTREGMKA